MYYLILAQSLLGAGGFAALLCNRNSRAATAAGASSCLLASITALIPVMEQFHSGGEPQWLSLFGLPFYLDRMAALFLLPVLVIGAMAAIHATEYLKGHDHGKSGVYWFFFNLTLASMTAVPLTTAPVAFLTVWELMGVASFALVAFDYRSPGVMRASWIYLAACHAGAGFLILTFLAMRTPETLDFTMVFLFGVAGFGLKAGFPLLHVWLPEAHPAAPAPVSALMSAAMINLGLYGILRIAVSPAGPAALYGWTLLILGLCGALLGVLFALPQRNLKRLLAYSSMENIGIIATGLGFGFLGRACENTAMAVFGFTGAGVHLLNHALLKGSLFLGAGSIQKAAGTLDLDRLGGLMKRMPFSGTLFTVNAIALSALPPFNGFLGELLIYLAAFCGIAAGSGALFAGSLAAVITLGLVGGVASVVFAKAISAAFLGEPRSQRSAEAVEVPRTMLLPQTALLGLSFLILIGAPFLVRQFLPFLSEVAAGRPGEVLEALMVASEILGKAVLFSLVIFGFILLTMLLRRLPARGRTAVPGATWDCGYAAPDARMEYTGSAFTQPLTDYFDYLLRSKKTIVLPTGLFPRRAAMTMEPRDPADRLLWGPLFRLTGGIADRIHVIQSGYLHLYILLMVAALVAMLAWGMLIRTGSEPPTSREPSPSEVVK